MDITRDPKVRKLIEWRARWLSNGGQIDYDDAKQDLWIETLKAYDRYIPSSKVEFSTFLYHHLRFRSINMLRAHYARVQREVNYAYLARRDYQPPMQDVFYFLDDVKSYLKPFDCRVLDELINPSPELLRIKKTYNSDKRRGSSLSNVHLALYLRVSQMTISRSMRKIEIATEKVKDGRRRRFPNADAPCVGVRASENER